jgi:hypothetical protein
VLLVKSSVIFKFISKVENKLLTLQIQLDLDTTVQKPNVIGFDRQI